MAYVTNRLQKDERWQRLLLDNWLHSCCAGVAEQPTPAQTLSWSIPLGIDNASPQQSGRSPKVVALFLLQIEVAI